MKIAKLLPYFCIVMLVIQTYLIFSYNWTSFSEKYDVAYWKDRYDHSQWQLRLSQRPIGDDALYAHAGYRLSQGDDPSLVITDKPPAALYLVGFSIKWFGNVAWMAFLAGVGSLVCLYLLGVKLLKNRSAALLVTTLFYLDPLFFSQLWKSWLDIYQLFFLLLNLSAFVYLVESERRRLWLAVLSGAAVCLFFETKMQTLFPVLVLLETAYLVKKRWWKEVFAYYAGFGVAVLLVYARYFMLGHSILELVKFHKYIATIYLISKLPLHPLGVLQSLFTGKVPNVNSGNLETVIEWTYLWPILGAIGLGVAVYVLYSKKETLVWRGMALILIASIIMYMRIPFYSRYLLLVLPFIYLLVAKFSLGYRRVQGPGTVAVMAIIILLLYAPSFLTAKPDSVLAGYYTNFSKQFFSDVYQENTTRSSVQATEREMFQTIAKTALFNAGVRAISFKEVSREFAGDNGKVNVELTYHTQDLGSFTETKELQLKRVHNRWGVEWNWGLLLADFSPEDTVKTSLVLGKRGTITQGGHVLVQDKQGFAISVRPDEIEVQQEEKLLHVLERFTGFTAVVIHDYYVQNRLTGVPTMLMTTWQDLKAEDQKELLSYKGVYVTPYPARIYSNSDYTHITNTAYTECCTRIYSSYNYHGVQGLEKQYDAQLAGYSGGTIILLDKQGALKRTILTKDGKNGQDISL